MRHRLLALAVAVSATACGADVTVGETTPPPAAATPPGAASASSAAPQTACGLLSAAEIAAAFKVATVAKDEVNSGQNDKGRVDLCSWFVRQGQPEGIVVKVRVAPAPEASTTAFVAGKLDIESIGRAVEVPDLGDEAAYAPYADGRGGTLVFRHGQTVVSLIGSLTRESLIDLAKIALPRMR